MGLVIAGVEAARVIAISSSVFFCESIAFLVVARLSLRMASSLKIFDLTDRTVAYPS